MYTIYFTDERIIQSLKALREATGFSLREAKDVMDQRQYKTISSTEYNNICKQLTGAGLQFKAHDSAAINLEERQTIALESIAESLKPLRTLDLNGLDVVLHNAIIQVQQSFQSAANSMHDWSKKI